MRHALAPLLLCLVACAPTPTLKLRTELVESRRLRPEVAKPIEDAHVAQMALINYDLEHAQERLTATRAAVAAAKTETSDAGTAEVHAAKLARAEHEVTWQESLIASIKWRRAVQSAATEVAKAEALTRVSQLDVDPFRRQHAKMRVELSRALERQAMARARFDEAGRHLESAKARYAAARVGTTVASTR